MHNLPMFKNAICDELKVSSWAEKHLVNLPSTPVNLELKNMKKKVAIFSGTRAEYGLLILANERYSK